MKKAYSKPEIVFENFSLSTNIAGDCEWKTNTWSSNMCGLESTGIGTVFMDYMTRCDFKADMIGEDDAAYGNICYHVPYGENLFNS